MLPGWRGDKTTPVYCHLTPPKCQNEIKYIYEGVFLLFFFYKWAPEMEGTFAKNLITRDALQGRSRINFSARATLEEQV